MKLLDTRWVVCRNKNPIGLCGKDYLCACKSKNRWVFIQHACWFWSKESAKDYLGKEGKAIIRIEASLEMGAKE